MNEDNNKTPEQLEQEWLQNTYQEGLPQLTVRAVITGMLLGGIMALSNIYIGLKTGWGMGVDVTAIILAFAIFRGLQSLGIVHRPFNMMESVIMMSVAVIASLISSAGLVSAIPALTMVSGRVLPWWQLMLWISSILLLGVFMAVPLKRQMITVERLKFPYNISVGETLKAIYATGGVAVKKAKALGITGLIGIAITISRDALGIVPALWRVPAVIGKVSWAKLTICFEPGMIMIGIGAIFGIKAGISMLLGVIVNYGILAPMLINDKIITHPAPAITAVTPITFPITVPAGDELSFIIEEADQSPEMSGGYSSDTLTYRWMNDRVYQDYSILITDLNGQYLNDEKTPNSLFEKIVFSEILDKSSLQNVLTARAVKHIHWEARLTVSPEEHSLSAVSGLGLKAGASRFEAVGGYRNIVSWSMWPGVGLLVVSGLLAFAFQYKTLGRTFMSVAGGFRKKKGKSKDILGHLEVPGTWFIIGFIVTGIPCVILQDTIFGIPIWMGILAVILSFFLAAVAARTAAEVGINPIGAMGKVTQLIYGVLAPGNMTTNLMAANITGGAACSCSDTVGNLKIGHMVGAHPRKQFIAQMTGVLAGAVIWVPAYYILVPDVEILGGEKIPPPSANIWVGG
ncbi:MAG: OPT/YSL family transporter, partial [FCB group bacterium]|nr:OPT/YSL family transporter [FCB group bacterium]